MTVVPLRGEAITPAVLIDSSAENLDTIEQLIHITKTKEGDVVIGWTDMKLSELMAASFHLQKAILNIMDEL